MAESEDVCQKLSVDYKGSSLRFRYERQSPESLTVIEFLDRDDLLIEVQSQVSDTSSWVLRQCPGRPLTVELYGPSSRLTYQAPSFWHLWTLHPELSTQMAPTVELLRPNWNLQQQIALIEEELRRRSPDVHLAAVYQAVRQLNDERFQTRQAAYHRLRAGGVAILPVLAGTDFACLGPEERHRLISVSRAASGFHEDQPSVVATWLLHDMQYWNERVLRAEGAERLWVLNRRELLQRLTEASSDERIAADQTNASRVR